MEIVHFDFSLHFVRRQSVRRRPSLRVLRPSDHPSQFHSRRLSALHAPSSFDEASSLAKLRTRTSEG
jgi:hypothetical protein